MVYDPSALLWISTLLLVSTLFVFSLLIRRRWLPTWLVENPVAYVLALGIAIGVWALFGSVGIAYERGYSYLSYFFGISIVFFLAPIFLIPLQRLKQSHCGHLHHLPDDHHDATLTGPPNRGFGPAVESPATTRQHLASYFYFFDRCGSFHHVLRHPFTRAPLWSPVPHWRYGVIEFGKIQRAFIACGRKLPSRFRRFCRPAVLVGSKSLGA
ncbi:MAG: hypothetical protein P8144_07205 [Gammaproteobacteria bacterium]